MFAYYNTKFEAQKQEDDSKSPTSRAASMPGMTIDSNKCDKVAGGDCMFDLPVPSVLIEIC